MEHNNAEDHIICYSSCVMSDNQRVILSFLLTRANPNTKYDTHSVIVFF